MDLDAEADLIPRTSDAARVALATYLSLNQPPEGDPRAAAHKAALVAADHPETPVCTHRRLRSGVMVESGMPWEFPRLLIEDAQVSRTMGNG